jgi:hypothetical protein
MLRWVRGRDEAEQARVMHVTGASILLDQSLLKAASSMRNTRESFIFDSWIPEEQPRGGIKREEIFVKGVSNVSNYHRHVHTINYNLIPSKASPRPTTPVDFSPLPFLTFLLILTTGKLNPSYSVPLSLQTSSNNLSSCKKLCRK